MSLQKIANSVDSFHVLLPFAIKRFWDWRFWHYGFQRQPRQRLTAPLSARCAAALGPQHSTGLDYNAKSEFVNRKIERF